jgi:hypothetical protein
VRDASEGARVRHDYVDAAEPPGRLLHPGGQRRVVAGVNGCADDLAMRSQLLGRELDTRRVPRADRDPHALGDQPLDHGPADATAAGRHQRLLARQPKVHVRHSPTGADTDVQHSMYTDCCI